MQVWLQAAESDFLTHDFFFSVSGITDILNSSQDIHIKCNILMFFSSNALSNYFGSLYNLEVFSLKASHLYF